MAKDTKKNDVPPAQAAAHDPWTEAQGNIPAELLAQFTEIDTAAGSTFPPYWNPQEGKMFVAAVVDVDARNPDFVRYTFIAAHDMICYRGEVDDQEEIKVAPGERFSVSAYFSLPLDEYIGIGNVHITVGDKIKLKSGNTMWKWLVKLTSTQKGQLAGIREEKHKAALAARGKGSKELEDKMFGKPAAQAPAQAGQPSAS